MTLLLEANSLQTAPYTTAGPLNREECRTVTDEALIDRVKDGQTEAFRFLVERYQDRVATTIKAMLGNTTEAEDVGQETFIRFYKALKDFRGDSSVGTYLNRIAINLSLNAIKRRKRLFNRFEDTDVATTMPSKDTVDPEGIDRKDLIQRALLGLKPNYRAVVVLRYIEGYSTKETAQLLDVPTGTVLSRLSRAQAKMKEWLLPYMSNEEK